MGHYYFFGGSYNHRDTTIAVQTVTKVPHFHGEYFHHMHHKNAAIGIMHTFAKGEYNSPTVLHTTSTHSRKCLRIICQIFYSNKMSLISVWNIAYVL